MKQDQNKSENKGEITSGHRVRWLAFWDAVTASSVYATVRPKCTVVSRIHTVTVVHVRSHRETTNHHRETANLHHRHISPRANLNHHHLSPRANNHRETTNHHHRHLCSRANDHYQNHHHRCEAVNIAVDRTSPSRPSPFTVATHDNTMGLLCSRLSLSHSLRESVIPFPFPRIIIILQPPSPTVRRPLGAVAVISIPLLHLLPLPLSPRLTLLHSWQRSCHFSFQDFAISLSPMISLPRR